jgi:hypothetical protein
VREKDNAAGPERVPLSSSVGGRDTATPYEALRCAAIPAISKGSTRPRYFTVFVAPWVSPGLVTVRGLATARPGPQIPVSLAFFDFSVSPCGRVHCCRQTICSRCYYGDVNT